MWGSCWIALECPRGELIVSSGADGECDWAWNVVFVHRYGFVTFQNQEDALKVLCDVSKSKMLGCPDLHLIVRSMRVYLVRRVLLFAHWLPFQKRQNPPEASVQFLKFLKKRIFKRFMETASLTRLSSAQPSSPVKSNGVTLKHRRLCVSQAYRKQKRSESAQTAVLLLGHRVAAHHSF